MQKTAAMNPMPPDDLERDVSDVDPERVRYVVQIQ
jgi:hypothetical protein